MVSQLRPNLCGNLQNIPIEVFALDLDIVEAIAAFPLSLLAGSLFLSGPHVEIYTAPQR
jgi:hypothetical protein